MKNHTTMLVRFGVPLGILLCAVVAMLSTVKSEIRWHLQHGFDVQTNGTRVRIPFFYKAEQETEHRLVAYMIPRRSFFGTEEPKYGVLRVEFASPDSLHALPERWNERAAWADRDQRAGADISEGSAAFAGRKGMCFQYQLPSSPLPYASFWGADVEVSCWFGPDVLARFHGTARSLADFHEMIRSAEDVRGKH